MFLALIIRALMETCRRILIVDGDWHDICAPIIFAFCSVV